MILLYSRWVTFHQKSGSIFSQKQHAANTHPNHDTIATFRKRFLPQLEELFVQILLIAQEAGFLKVGKVSLDGTKIKANASKHKALSYAHANKLQEQLESEVKVPYYENFRRRV